MYQSFFEAPPRPKPAAAPLTIDEITVYDEVAVNENYDGKLAVHQTAELRKSGFNTAVVVVIAYSITLILSLSAWGDHLGTSLLQILLLFIICTVICIAWFKRIYQLRRDISNNTVLHIDGRVGRIHTTIHGRYGGRGVRYSLVINGVQFVVPEKAYDMCRINRLYRVYYMPMTRDFLNVHSL